MTESEMALRLDRLTKHYGSIAAVDNVSLGIRRGEFFTFLGPSGSGKSTTLLLIAGFESSTAGEVYLEGKAMSGVPSHKRGIGVVFQNYALFPHLTVFENIAFALRNLHWGNSEVLDRVRELLSLVKLEGLGERVPAQLSGGQQQRVALARALAFRPSVLLLDEPLGALDRKLREHMVMEFRRIHQTIGSTMVYVSHDQEEALAMSDRVAVMNHGRLVQVGTPRDLYENPIDAFVADFLGDTSILHGIKRESGDIGLEGSEEVVAVSNHIPVGTKVRIVVRPERILLGVVPAGWNSIGGRVDEVVYLGEATRYRIRTGGSVVRVKQLNGFHMPTYEVGTEVRLSWHPADSRIIEDGG